MTMIKHELLTARSDMHETTTIIVAIESDKPTKKREVSLSLTRTGMTFPVLMTAAEAMRLSRLLWIAGTGGMLTQRKRDMEKEKEEAP